MAHRATIAPSRELALANLTVKHARDVLGFLRTNPMAGTALSRFRVQLDHRWLLRFGLAERARALARIRAAAWPAHHALWLCISHGEGGIRSINPNGHYGMLQMHAGWGYGTSYYASDDSQIVQEQAAERGFRASHWSLRWLWGQWAADYGRCSGYA